MRALIYGAGNIGRGFLGSLLSKAGAATTFVDVDQTKINIINTVKECLF